MEYNKETMLDYYKSLIENRTKKLSILNDKSNQYTKEQRVEKSMLYTARSATIAEKTLDIFNSIPDNSGFITKLTALSLPVQTYEDHIKVKNFLMSKGFESNEYNRKKKNNKVYALIGSDSIEGLLKLNKELESFCKDNLIKYDNSRFKNITERRHVFETMSDYKTSILLGSKVGDIINFELDGPYRFPYTPDKEHTPNFISFDKTPYHESQPKSSLGQFINKMINRVESTLGMYGDVDKIVAKKGEIRKARDMVYSLTGIDIDIDYQQHMTNNAEITPFKAVELELDRFNRIVNELTNIEQSGNEPVRPRERLEERKTILKRNGVKI